MINLAQNAWFHRYLLSHWWWRLFVIHGIIAKQSITIRNNRLMTSFINENWKTEHYHNRSFLLRFKNIFPQRYSVSLMLFIDGRKWQFISTFMKMFWNLRVRSPTRQKVSFMPKKIDKIFDFLHRTEFYGNNYVDLIICLGTVWFSSTSTNCSKAFAWLYKLIWGWKNSYSSFNLKLETGSIFENLG